MKSTKVILVTPDDPETEAIEEAAQILRAGGLVAFPTETVYGLAAVYGDEAAVNRLYEVKQRPGHKPFAMLISDEKMMEDTGVYVPPAAKALMDRFWPGPLTIILKAKEKGKTIAFRMPDNKIARELVGAAGAPLAAPSANMSGSPSPVTAEDVLNDLGGRIDAVIDGGRTRIGVDSTIVDASGPLLRIVRKGAVSGEALKSVCLAAIEG
ncbi:MAG: L-threonylcarbamoyladenylate synthase [Candidatus Omnitrophota bacterium]